MKFIYTNELKNKIIKKLNFFYIFIGEDLILLKKNKKIILNFAKKKGFIENDIIHVESNIDWKKITNFYNLNNLFFIKKVLIIHLNFKKLDFLLIENIKKLLFLKNFNIVTILKCNKLSNNFKNLLLTNNNVFNADIIWCFTPKGENFKHWLKYEIQERKINISNDAFLLLCKYYKGNTLYIYHMLNMITLTWKNKNITLKNVKNIINTFYLFTPTDWINAIFQNKIEKAFYILDTFYKQKYNVLILIRSLQKDLLILLNIKRTKNININIFLKKNNIFIDRIKFFNLAIKSINFNNFLKVIKILLQIEIKIKAEYNSDVWFQLKTITSLLSLPT